MLKVPESWDTDTESYRQRVRRRPRERIELQSIKLE